MVNPIGCFDGMQGGQLHGWAWDPARPEARLTVDVFEGAERVLSARADRFRPDLLEQGIGDGAHSFILPYPERFAGKDRVHLSFRCRELGRELEGSPFRFAKPLRDENGLEIHRSLIVEPGNLESLLSEGSGKSLWRIHSLLVEPISACNADCLYCPYVRSGARLDPAGLKTFLESTVARIDQLQLGCAHEPTTHFGLVEYFELAAGLSRPPDEVTLVTNGTLLHRHDVRRWAELGLKRIKVSIDSADPELQRKQRPGTELETILRNLEGFRDRAPGVKIDFISVVTSLNAGAMGDLIELGKSLGVSCFRLREVAHRLEPNPRQGGFHERCEELRLGPGEFAKLEARLRAEFPSEEFFFLGTSSYFAHSPTRSLGADAR